MKKKLEKLEKCHSHQEYKETLPNQARSNTASQSSTQPQATNNRTAAVNIEILKTTVGDASVWLLPHCISQSTYAGRVGSNACSLITLIMAHQFHINSPNLHICNHQVLPSIWIQQLVDCITSGNSIHDFNFGHQGVNLSVPEAQHLLHLIPMQLGVELPVSFVACQGDPPQATLIHHLHLLNTPVAVILNGNTFCFLPDNNGHLVFVGSHLHGSYGALIAHIPKAFLGSFLEWFKRCFHPGQENLCTITNLHF